MLAALEQAQGNKSRAAALLGVSRKTLYARMRRLGIPLESDDSPTPPASSSCLPAPQPPAAGASVYPVRRA